MVLSQKRLLHLLGALWLIDGLFQLQPQMFTVKMVDGVLSPIIQGQPLPLVASLNWIIAIITQHLTQANLLIAAVQILIGGALIVGSRRYPSSNLVKGALSISIAWSLIVWYGGEGMSMLLTGQASMLMGAPGAVLLYALLALVLYPRREQTAEKNPVGILSRQQLRWCLAEFWFLAAMMQLQPFWWQSGQISQAIGGMSGQGGWNSLFVDPVLNWLSQRTGSTEIQLNIALILVFIGLGAGMLMVKNERARWPLALSVVISFVVWWGAQGFGMIFTGVATDFNSGLLVIVMTLACWPRAHHLMEERAAFVLGRRQAEQSPQRG